MRDGADRPATYTKEQYDADRYVGVEYFTAADIQREVSVGRHTLWRWRWLWDELDDAAPSSSIRRQHAVRRPSRTRNVRNGAAQRVP